MGHRPGMLFPVTFNLLSTSMLSKRTTAPRKHLTKLDEPQLNLTSAVPAGSVHDIGAICFYHIINLTISACVPLIARLQLLGFCFVLLLSPPKMKGASSPAVPVMAVAKPLICRVPSSVEAINHELENVFIREGWEHGIQVGARVHSRGLSQCWRKVSLPPDGPHVVFIQLLS